MKHIDEQERSKMKDSRFPEYVSQPEMIDEEILRVFNEHKANLIRTIERVWFEDSWRETVIDEDEVISFARALLAANRR